MVEALLALCLHMYTDIYSCLHKKILYCYLICIISYYQGTSKELYLLQDSQVMFTCRATGDDVFNVSSEMC